MNTTIDEAIANPELQATDLVPLQRRDLGPFSSPDSFGQYMQMARALASSSMVPKQYRGEEHLGDCLLALDMASRMNANPLMIMQNLHMIEGKPSWSSAFLISTVNSSGRFTPLRFRLERDEEETKVEYTLYKKDWSARPPKSIEEKKTATIVNARCTAYATELASQQVLEGTTVDLIMALKEGWYDKNGSKWQTMPDHMLRWRAASFWVKQYAPEMSMGIPSEDESRDVIDVTPESVVVEGNGISTAAQDIIDKARDKGKEDATTDQGGESERGEWPKRDDSGIWRDSRGLSFDGDIHGISDGGVPAVTKKGRTEGQFCKRRGCDPQLHAERERQQMEAMAAAQSSAEGEEPDPNQGGPSSETGQAQDASQPASGADADPSSGPSFGYPEINTAIARAATLDACDLATDMLRSFTGPDDQRAELQGLLDNRRSRIEQLTGGEQT